MEEEDSRTNIDSPIAPPPQLSSHLHHWTKITSDKKILGLIQEGYSIPLTQQPPLASQPSNFSASISKTPLISLAIQDLLQKDALELADSTSPGFYSNLFLRQKPNGEWRPIVNLKRLNRHVHIDKMTLITPRSVRELLPKDSWATLLDLKDAYFHILIHPDSRKFLRVMWQDQAYQFKRLPFGLSSAPFIFTRLTRPILSHLHGKGVNVLPYLDDWLILAQNQAETADHTRIVLDLFSKLGLIVSPKSVLQPTQTIKWLGIGLNLQDHEFFIPEDKRLEIQTKISDILQKEQISVKGASMIIGKLVFIAPYLPNGMFHLRPLQMWFKNQAGHQKLDHEMMTITEESRESLLHWSDASFLQKTTFVTFPKYQEVTLTTDASDIGWGAHLDQRSVSGVWPPSTRAWHINAKEMKAVHLAIKAFAHLLISKVIHIKTDNTTVMYQINKGGSTKSLRLLSVLGDIYSLSHKLNSCLIASHIPGKQNIKADLLSRMTTVPAEWTLHPRIFQHLCRRWGHPSIDLFSSHSNHQTHPYCTIEQDAFSLDWSQMKLIYAFPPFALIQRVLVELQKLQQYQVILITPLWRSRPWYPLLLKLQPSDRISLSHIQNKTLFQEVGEEIIWEEEHHYQLVAWRLSKP